MYEDSEIFYNYYFRSFIHIYCSDGIVVGSVKQNRDYHVFGGELRNDDKYWEELLLFLDFIKSNPEPLFKYIANKCPVETGLDFEEGRFTFMSVSTHRCRYT